MKPDNESSVNYFSRKQKYTVNTQAVVGSNVIFLDLATGFSGSIHNARMLQETKLYQDDEANMILSKPTDVLENKEVSPLLISYGAYQATSWQLKPYPFTIRLNDTQRKIDKLSFAQVTVERTFGLLKGPCLLKLLDNRLNNISFIIIASFVLHNIC